MKIRRQGAEIKRNLIASVTKFSLLPALKKCSSDNVLLDIGNYYIFTVNLSFLYSERKILHKVFGSVTSLSANSVSSQHFSVRISA